MTLPFNKRRVTFLVQLLGVLTAFLVSANGVSASDWHHPLALDRGGYWQDRIQVQVQNKYDRKLSGEPVSISINGEGATKELIGARAGEVRVCKNDGTELLFRLRNADGTPLESGPIPEGSRLIFPAEVQSGATSTCYVYFNNSDAWPVGEFLNTRMGVCNGSMENGTDEHPRCWEPDTGDARHTVSWSTERPHSGDRCLKTEVSKDASVTWIAHRQRNIHVVGGARYRMEGWVRARQVNGFAGWYIHVGTESDPMMLSRHPEAGDGSFDWKHVSITFEVPKTATTASLGTVLRGTGTAWFDDVSLERLERRKLDVSAGEHEHLTLTKDPKSEWSVSSDRWPYRSALKVLNLEDHPRNALLLADPSRFTVRLNRRGAGEHIRLMDGNEEIQSFRLGERLAFSTALPARSTRTFYAYFSGKDTTVQDPSGRFTDLLNNELNLLENPGFEDEKDPSSTWRGENTDADSHRVEIRPGGRFGDRSGYIHVSQDSDPGWVGWRQKVFVKPGQTYLYAAWLKGEDVRSGEVQLHAHVLNSNGELCENNGLQSAGTGLSGTFDWTLVTGFLTVPPDGETFEAHLTMNATGTLRHDGVLIAPASRVSDFEPLEVAPSRQVEEFTAWPVNPIVKVFRDDPPPRNRKNGPVRISAARNEKEPLQIAVRGTRDLENVSVRASTPTNDRGTSLNVEGIGVVGYVPIDRTSGYDRFEGPAWHRKIPPERDGGSDGWAGHWPDPILPRNTFDLSAHTTQPVWITIDVPEDVQAGTYDGRVTVQHRSEILATIPFTVRVRDFTLPERSNLKAIFDVRGIGPKWRRSGESTQEARRRMWKFMAEYRTNPGRIRPGPDFTYEDGEVQVDFEQYDRSANLFLNEMNFQHTYMPHLFNLFGWGHPPDTIFGIAPYPGSYPYEESDRGELRPEYRTAYQSALSSYWNHMNEKGWADDSMLYISDEPWYRLDRIKKQMKALGDMIHDVDADIPIYSSTWHHRPEWGNTLDVWGIGNTGHEQPEIMRQIRERGDRILFTTDGQMCTDTPYCAVERLLPYYCFAFGAEGYEFWGIDWLTHNPYEYGWHRYIEQSGQPGNAYHIRYPNGDGFLVYPGKHVNHPRPVPSIRLAQVREGVEDYAYLRLLKKHIDSAKDQSLKRKAKQLLNRVSDLTPVPDEVKRIGRYSTEMLPRPRKVQDFRSSVAETIEELKRD